MISPSHVLAFAAASFVLIAVPGPSVLFTVSRALVLGRRAGLATVAGNGLGFFVHVVAVAFGLGAVVERSVVVFTVVKVVGAAYLVYLGVQAIRRRRSLATALTSAVPVATTGRTMREGFVVGLTNPKTIVFLVAMLPQFVDPGGGPASLQLLLLGGTFTVMALVLDSCWAVGAGAARSWLMRAPWPARHLGTVGGAVMIGLGARLAATGRPD